jgi:hypothetical protein
LFFQNSIVGCSVGDAVGTEVFVGEDTSVGKTDSVGATRTGDAHEVMIKAIIRTATMVFVFIDLRFARNCPTAGGLPCMLLRGPVHQFKIARERSFFPKGHAAYPDNAVLMGFARRF